MTFILLKKKQYDFYEIFPFLSGQCNVTHRLIFLGNKAQAGKTANTILRFIEPGHNFSFFNLLSLINSINGLKMIHNIKISSKTHDNHRTWRIENEAETVTWYSITCAYSTTMRISLFPL